MRFKQVKPYHVKNKDLNEGSHINENGDNLGPSLSTLNWNNLDFVNHLVPEMFNPGPQATQNAQNGHGPQQIDKITESTTPLKVHKNNTLSPSMISDSDVIIHGRRPIFSESEEINIATKMKEWKEQGKKYTRLDVVNMASEYAVRLGKRPHFRPLTVKWFRSFLTRHPECYLRKSRRSKCEQPEKQYFNHLDTILTANNLKKSPHCIFSLVELPMPVLKNGEISHCDEFSLNKCSMNEAKSHCKLTLLDKVPSSVLFCGSAAGQALPPFLLFAGKMMDKSYLAGLTPGAGGMASPTGRATSEVLVSFLRDHFLSQAPGRAGDTLVLLLDSNLGCSVSQAVADIGSAFKVVFVTAQATFNPQLHPMVVACCDTFQRELSYELQRPLFMSKSTPLPASSVRELLCRLYHRNMTAENLHATFKKAGLFPFNPTVCRKQYAMPAISADSLSGQAARNSRPVSNELVLRLRRTNNKPKLQKKNKTAANVAGH